MSELPAATDPLDDIELRQADLLRRLDELNERVEKALREQLQRCTDTAQSRALQSYMAESRAA